MTNPEIAMQNVKEVAKDQLTFFRKTIYGTGDLGRASFNTLRQIFYAIFLTDVVGIEPRLASLAALVSIIWDAVNDPIVGALSDNVQTKWGRRRPFLLIFSVPFALAFLLLWWAPPWQSQAMLLIHITLAYMVSDTIQTLVTVPYLALTPEIASEYDDRTSLTSFRMFFNLLASLATAVAAPIIVDAAIKNGFTLQQGYVTVAAIFGVIAVFPYLLIFIFIKEKRLITQTANQAVTFRKTLSLLWQNSPFRYATGIYVLNWISFDIVALMLPYFILYWISKGNLLASINIFGEKIAVESVILGVMLIVATATIPFWNWVAHKSSKRVAYIAGMLLWILLQISILFVQPGQVGLVIGIAAIAGIGVSTAHIMPEAIFPDVIDWDEVKTHQRHEGMYYGAINFIRKLSSAFAVFLSLQILGWFGYQAPPVGAAVFTQAAGTLQIIRLLTGPLVIVFLVLAIVFTIGYPINRERQRRIQRLLKRRHSKTNPA